MQLRTVKMLVLKHNSVRLKIVLKRVKKNKKSIFARTRARASESNQTLSDRWLTRTRVNGSSKWIWWVYFLFLLYAPLTTFPLASLLIECSLCISSIAEKRQVFEKILKRELTISQQQLVSHIFVSCPRRRFT